MGPLKTEPGWPHHIWGGAPAKSQSCPTPTPGHAYPPLPCLRCGDWGPAALPEPVGQPAVPEVGLKFSSGLGAGDKRLPHQPEALGGPLARVVGLGGWIRQASKALRAHSRSRGGLRRRTSRSPARRELAVSLGGCQATWTQTSSQAARSRQTGSVAFLECQARVWGPALPPGWGPWVTGPHFSRMKPGQQARGLWLVTAAFGGSSPGRSTRTGWAHRASCVSD